MPPSKRFVCPFCEHVCCKQCVQKYILGSADDPNCMNCSRHFDRELLTNRISQKFVDRDLKSHREAVLLERETAMMPGTQVHVNQEVQRRNNVKLLAAMQNERMELKRKLRELDVSHWDLQRQLVPPLETERRQFVHRCAHEGCRGYLSNAWKCSICERYTCSECNAPRGHAREDDHVCDDDQRETVRLIKNDSRKCPGCGEFIFKVSGCDQMWCTSCHTAFSWKTGQKVNGSIHNPHFYEFQRHAGVARREAADIPCGGMPTYREVREGTRNSRTTLLLSSSEYDFLIHMHRLTTHIDDTELPRFNIVEINENSNLDIRIRYMLNEISEAHFKEKLQQREKKNQKKREIYMILQMFTQSISDFYRQALINGRYRECIDNIRALVVYFNNTLKDVSQKYVCVVPQIDITIASSPRFLSLKAYRT